MFALQDANRWGRDRPSGGGKCPEPWRKLPEERREQHGNAYVWKPVELEKNPSISEGLRIRMGRQTRRADPPEGEEKGLRGLDEGLRARRKF